MNVSPSILTCDFTRLDRAVSQVVSWGADAIHLDVMDGVFVPNLSFGPAVIEALRPLTSLPFDVHLMLQAPTRLLDDIMKAGADNVALHIESEVNLREVLRYLRQNGRRAGVAVNPSTPVEVLFPLLGHFDYALLMSVEPGFGGQTFKAETLKKSVALKREAHRRHLSVEVEIDGGVNAGNLSDLAFAGVDTVVMGSALFGGANPPELVSLAHQLCLAT